MHKMRRKDWQELQTEQHNRRNRKNRKSKPKRRSGLRPYRKAAGSYVEWLASVGVTP